MRPNSVSFGAGYPACYLPPRKSLYSETQWRLDTIMSEVGVKKLFLSISPFKFFLLNIIVLFINAKGAIRPEVPVIRLKARLHEAGVDMKGHQRGLHQTRGSTWVNAGRAPCICRELELARRFGWFHRTSLMEEDSYLRPAAWGWWQGFDQTIQRVAGKSEGKSSSFYEAKLMASSFFFFLSFPSPSPTVPPPPPPSS